MPFLLDLAWRDLKASGRSLWVFVACLILGVTLVAASGGLYRMIHQSLLADTRVLMGGDVEIQTSRPLPAAVQDWIRTRGELSLVIEVDTMLGTGAGDFLRTELQSMDANYPLYGELTLAPAQALSSLTAFTEGYWGVAVDPVLADKLALSVGDSVFIGSLEMKVRALVLSQPDRRLNASWRGTPVLLSYQAIESAGLIQTGSRIEYEYRVRTEMEAEQWRTALQLAFPDLAAEVRTFEDRNRRLAERLGQIVSGIMIIAFCTLFVGGLGVFNSIQAYLQGKLNTIAILRSLGLRNRRLAAVYLLQIALLSGGASLAGGILGVVLALASASLLASELPLTLTLSVLLVPLLVAMLFGMLTAYAFALPALGRALSVKAGVLFSGTRQESAALPSAWRLATVFCALFLIGLVWLALPDMLFGIGFIIVVGLLLSILDAVVKLVRWCAQRLDDHPMLTGRFAWRLALANLYRPGAPLRTALLSLGSALTLLVVCTLVVAALFRAVNSTIPEESPALVLYDVLPHQLDPVVAILHQMPGTRRVDSAPLVRARITSINDRPLSELLSTDALSLEKALQDEYKLSYSANNIDGVTLTEGAWWTEPVTGRAKIALEDREAKRLGVGVEDSMVFDIEGYALPVEIAAIFSQKGLQTRFWFEAIISDQALEPVSQRFVGAAYMSDEGALSAQNRIAALAPNVITVRTEMLLATARDMMEKASSALLVVALVSLCASMLVLSSVIAASQSRQIYEASILHSLGTRLSVIRQSLLLEYLLLAVLASVFAIVLGTAIAMPLLEWRLKLPSGDLIWLAAAVALLISLVSLAAGARYVLQRMQIRPAILLRDA
jgi:putative ABC transport system permease protein